MCCGQKRSALQNQTRRTVAPSSSHSSRLNRARPSSAAEDASIRVRGLVSGRFYKFGGSYPVEQVDARDAPSLLNTRFFDRA